jgi:hypothetical protein
MHVVLFLVGIVLAFAGAVLIYMVPVPLADAGAAALFSSGALAMVGGLVLMGLAAAVRALNRIAERLEIQPLPLPPIAAVGREDPAPRPARPQPAPAAAPTTRPSLLGWFGRGSAPVPATVARAPVQRATPAAEAASPAVDLAPLTRMPEEPRAPGPVAPPAPLAPPAPAPVAAPAPPPPPPKPVPPKPAARPAAPAPANGTPETTVYKSGVIDGMAYTLFMDGAIEAELPQGRVKFGSVDELQKYLTSRQ